MTDTTSSKDPRQIAAEIDLAEATARKAAAEATAAEVANLIPDISKATASTLTPPSAPPPLATVAAYSALADVGKTIMKKLPRTGDVWIVPDSEYQTAIATYDAVASELTHLRELSTEAVTTVTTGGGASFAGPAVALVASAVPMLMSLFATSRTVVTAGVTLDFKSAAAAVAAADTERPVSVMGITPPGDAGLGALIQDLQKARDDLDRALVNERSAWSLSSTEATATAEAEAWKVVLAARSEHEPAKIDETVAHITEAVRRANDARTQTAAHGNVIKSCEQLLQTVDDMLQQVTGSTGAALAAQCALGAVLKNAHVLVLLTSYSGATTDYDHRVGKDRALHMGSAVVTWYLLQEGQALEAGIECAHDSATTYVGDAQVTWATRPQQGTADHSTGGGIA